MSYEQDIKQHGIEEGVLEKSAIASRERMTFGDWMAEELDGEPDIDHLELGKEVMEIAKNWRYEPHIFYTRIMQYIETQIEPDVRQKMADFENEKTEG